MARKIQFKRGLEKDLPLLDVAEFGFTTDTERLFLGSHNENIEMVNKKHMDDQIDEKTATLKQQLDTMVIDGDSSVEAAQARIKADGTTYTTLKERLDTTDAQLAEKAQQVDLENTKIEVSKKANQTELNQANTEISGLDQRIDNLVIPISAENANIEVTDSHVSVTKGKTYDSLTERLEDGEKSLNKLAGISMENSIINGDLANGTNDWFGTGTTSLSVDSDGLTGENIGVGGSFNIRNSATFNEDVGDKIYIGFWAKSNTTKDCGSRSTPTAYPLYIFNPTAEFRKFSYITTVTTKTDHNHNFFITGAETGDTLTIDNIIHINLTKSFGLGEEPALEEFEEMLAMYPESWFDGESKYGSKMTKLLSDKFKTTKSDVDSLKLTVSNKLTNSDFSNGTTGWTAYTPNTLTVANGTGEFLATAQNSSLYQNGKVEADHVYYLRGKIKTESNLVSLTMGATYSTHSGNNTFENLSLVHKATAAHGGFVIDGRSSGWTPIYVDRMLLLDLTEIFGAGNEPTKERVDELVSVYEDGWFEKGSLFNSSNVLGTLYSVDNKLNMSLDGIRKQLLYTPEYVRPMLRDIGTRVNALQHENTYTFGFITDTHTRFNTMHFVSTIAEASKYINLDFIAHGGDFIDGFGVKDGDLKRIEEVMVTVNDRKTTPFLFCNGDHDDNNFYARDNGNTPDLYIKDIELYNRTTRFSERNVVVGSREKQYYYLDNEVSKVRTIVVNTTDIPKDELNPDGTRKYNEFNNKAYSNEQLNWIAHTALNFSNKETPSDWGVVILGHIAGDSMVTNSNVLNSILTAYNNGTSYIDSGTTQYGDWSINVDFSNQGQGDFIAFFMGHLHRDDIVTNEAGFPVIITLNASLFKDYPTAPDKTLGTETETAWDVVTIDRSSRNIYLTRFGAGADRSTTY